MVSAPNDFLARTRAAKKVMVLDLGFLGGTAAGDRQVEASGKRLGIIGFGSIGRLVAKRAFALDMDVVACDSPDVAPDPSWPGFSR